MRNLICMGLAQALLLLAGCGGGSGTVITAPAANNTGSGNGSGAPNVVTMSIDSGPQGQNADTPYITVTVCQHGSTTNCQQIDHIEVDTGSYGLRIISSVLNSSLAGALTAEIDSSTGNPIVECTQFLDGFTWGPVKLADMQVAGESASGIPVQVMGDPAYEQTSSNGASTTSEIPTACSSTGSEEDTVATFGANGIIGVGPFGSDCGTACNTPVSSANNPGWYYECPASSWSASNPCSEVAVPEPAQVTNPVVFFPTDNNGVVVELPAATEGASTATGTLVFGVGTESNNGVNGQTVLFADPNFGDINTAYTTLASQVQILPFSFFDTGSNAYFFADDSIPSSQGCSTQPGYDSANPASWFCPSSELHLSAVNSGAVQNGTQSPVSFSIGNAYSLFNQYRSGTVFNDLGGSSGPQPTDCTSQSTASQDTSCSFDFGLPFFLGRNVFIAIAGKNTSAGMGPYFAY